MKCNIIFYILFLFLTQFSAFGQVSEKKDSCINLFNGSVKAYIPGYEDSTIKRYHVMNGFNLRLSDTSYRIINYSIVFDFADMLVSLQSNGSRLVPSNKDYAGYLNGIKPPSILTVEFITVAKGEACYKIRPLLYHIKE
jgi:hypothetical protein